MANVDFSLHPEAKRMLTELRDRWGLPHIEDAALAVIKDDRLAKHPDHLDVGQHLDALQSRRPAAASPVVVSGRKLVAVGWPTKMAGYVDAYGYNWPRDALEHMIVRAWVNEMLPP